MNVATSASDGSTAEPVSGRAGRLPCFLLNTFMPSGDITKLTNFSARSLFLALALTP